MNERYLCLWIGWLNNIKMMTLLRVIYKVNKVSKFQWLLCTETESQSENSYGIARASSNENNLEK